MRSSKALGVVGERGVGAGGHRLLDRWCAAARARHELATTIDDSFRRFDVVWAAAGTPHDVFGIRVETLIGAIPGASVIDVS